MTIASELTNLQQDITNARTAITAKGGQTTPSGGSSQLATDIATIPTGITPTGNIALTATTSTQTGINVTNYATASVAPTPSESKTLTLGSSAPATVTPTSGKYLSSVPVSIDTSVIKADNIAQGATILGVAGTHSGGGGRLKDISPVTENGYYGVQSDLILVESMTGTGQGYFPTDIVLADSINMSTQYDIEYCIVRLNNSGNSTVFGCAGTVSGYTDNLYSMNTGSYNYTNNGYYGFYVYYVSTAGTEYTYKTDLTEGKLLINSSVLSPQTSSRYLKENTTLDIFALHNANDTHTDKFSDTFKYLKIKNTGGDLLYWFVPARNSNNEPLIYEKVNNKVYPLVGSGITLGNDISDESYIGFKSPLTVNVPKETLYGYGLDVWAGKDNDGTLPKRELLGENELRFTGLKKTVADFALAYRFYNALNIPSIIFPDLEEISGYGLYYAFARCTAQSGAEIRMPKLKKVSSYSLSYMCTSTSDIDYVEIGNSNDLYDITTTYSFQNSFHNTYLRNGFKVKGVRNIAGGYAFQNAFYSSATNFNYWDENTPCEFTDLEIINAAYAMYYVVYKRGAKEGKKWNVFPKLKTVNGNNCFLHAFNGFYFGLSNIYPQKQHIITFPKLETIGATSGSTVFGNMLYGVTQQWAYCWFPMLKTIGVGATSSYGFFNNAFTGTTKANYFEVCMPELENLLSTSTSTTATYGCFNACTVIKKFWLPKLKQVTGTPNATNMFKNCTQSGLEIHFGIENQSYISGLAGYASKFGATNSTIYFDCVNHITVNGTVYDRDGEHYITECPVIQTSGGAMTHPDDRYSWKDTNGNIVYTLECWTPAVGDNVYDANDNIVGTIGAIA